VNCVWMLMYRTRNLNLSVFLFFWDRKRHCHLLGILPPGVKSLDIQKQGAVKTQKPLPANRHNIDLPTNEEEMHLDQPITRSNRQLGSTGQSDLPVEESIIGLADVSDSTHPFLTAYFLDPWRLLTMGTCRLTYMKFYH